MTHACQNFPPKFNLFIGQLWTAKPNFSSKSADLEVLLAQKPSFRLNKIRFWANNTLKSADFELKFGLVVHS